MNDYTLESFINFCDNMMIAEEGLLAKNEKYNEFAKVSKDFYRQIEKEKNLKKRLELSKGYRNTLMNINESIKKEPDSESTLKFLVKGPKAIFKNNLLHNSKNAPTIMQNLSNELKKSSDIIDVHDYALKKGAVTINDIHGPNGIATDINSVDAALKFQQVLNKVKPVSMKFATKEEYVDFMASDTINFLNSYVSSPSFKKRYSKYLYMIEIEETDYSDLFSITITRFQDGVDIDENNAWYHELLDIGEGYIAKRFSNWRGKIWYGTDTGDGDEGTIYVS